MKWIRQLFCKHKFVHEFGVGNTYQSKGMECLYCKKFKKYK